MKSVSCFGVQSVSCFGVQYVSCFGVQYVSCFGVQGGRNGTSKRSDFLQLLLESEKEDDADNDNMSKDEARELKTSGGRQPLSHVDIQVRSLFLDVLRAHVWERENDIDRFFLFLSFFFMSVCSPSSSSLSSSFYSFTSSPPLPHSSPLPLISAPLLLPLIFQNAGKKSKLTNYYSGSTIVVIHSENFGEYKLALFFTFLTFLHWY